MHNDEMMLCGKVSSGKSFDPFCNCFESIWWICVGVRCFRANTRKCLRHRFFINGTKVVRLNLLSMLHRDMQLFGSACVTHLLDWCTRYTIQCCIHMQLDIISQSHFHYCFPFLPRMRW